MNISFNKNVETPVAGVVVESVITGPADSVPSTSLATVPVTSVPTPYFNDADINFRDIIVPRLNVVQNVGDLAVIFTPGQIVLNSSAVIHVPANTKPVSMENPNPAGSGPLVLIPIGCRPLQYAEKVGGGAKGMFVNTEQEVVAANGTLDYKEWKNSKGTANVKRRFEEYATFLFLVKKPAPNAAGVSLLPDAEHQLFTHEIEGEYYTLALMGLKGTWYSGFAKRLFTERKIGFLGAGYATFNWNVSTLPKSFIGEDGGKVWAIVPAVTNGTRSTPALLDYVKDHLGFGS